VFDVAMKIAIGKMKRYGQSYLFWKM